MSFEASAIAFNHSRAKGTAKLILLGIASHDGDGGAWPSIATLARYGNCTARNAQMALAKLVELGEIRIYQNQGGTVHTPDHARPNLYEFLLTCPPDCDRSKQHRSRYELHPLKPTSPPEASDTTPLKPTSPETPYNYLSNKDLNKTNLTNARARVLPAPKYPKFKPESPRRQPRLRSAAEAAKVAELEQQTCPAAPKFKHWFPSDLISCARGCSTSLSDAQCEQP